jgi:hypothetical protein
MDARGGFDPRDPFGSIDAILFKAFGDGRSDPTEEAEVGKASRRRIGPAGAALALASLTGATAIAILSRWPT